MNNIFPETMNKLNPEDAEKSFSTVDNYIAYMCERMDFYVKSFSTTIDKQNQLIKAMQKQIDDLNKEAKLRVGMFSLVSDSHGFSIRNGES